MKLFYDPLIDLLQVLGIYWSGLSIALHTFGSLRRLLKICAQFYLRIELFATFKRIFQFQSQFKQWKRQVRRAARLKRQVRRAARLKRQVNFYFGDDFERLLVNLSF